MSTATLSPVAPAALGTSGPAAVLEIKPVAGRIGAKVKGVRLSGDLDEKTVSAINAALLKHKVLFFRDQGHLDNAEQERFAALLGDLVSHPTVPSLDGTGHLLELDSERGGRANSWHTDVTFDLNPPKISILRGVENPAVGGDTTWANTVTAYADLPPDLQALAEKLRAIHTNEYDYAAVYKPEVSEAQLEKSREVFTSTLYETEHPVVRVHPETGERSLLLGHFIKRFVGYSASDSKLLFNLLQGHVTRLENTVRWRWKSGDLVIWDNRATQHYAINDYGNQKRVVRRVTLAGDIPVGVDGQPGRSLHKEVRRSAEEVKKLHAKAV